MLIEPVLSIQVARFVAQNFVSQEFAPQLLAAMPPGFVVHDLLACVTQPYMLAKGACSALIINVLLTPCVNFYIVLRTMVADRFI